MCTSHLDDELQVVFDMHKSETNPRTIFSIRVDPKTREDELDISHGVFSLTLHSRTTSLQVKCQPCTAYRLITSTMLT
jgi:hypothetical protein